MQTLSLRLIHTHDTQANWDKCVDFIPKAGEVIVYDTDENFSYERFKIGDGVTKLSELQFTVDKIVESILHVENNIVYADAGRITNYKDKSDT